MNKLLSLILSLLIVVLLIGIFSVRMLFLLDSEIDSEPALQNTFPTPVTPTDIHSSEMNIKTTDGSVTMRNFLLHTSTIPDATNNGHYYLGNYIDPSVDLPPQVPYVIEYIVDTQHFNIALLQEPIKEARSKAEQFFLQNTGIAEDDACKLSYMVSVPNRVNEFYAGTNLGFSFCPGSVSLE